MLGADPRDPRVAQVLDEIGAKDHHRHTVARSLLPVEDSVLLLLCNYDNLFFIL